MSMCFNSPDGPLNDCRGYKLSLTISESENPDLRSFFYEQYIVLHGKCKNNKHYNNTAYNADNNSNNNNNNNNNNYYYYYYCYCYYYYYYFRSECEDSLSRLTETRSMVYKRFPLTPSSKKIRCQLHWQ